MITRKRSYVITRAGEKSKVFSLAEYARKNSISYQCAYKRMKAGTLNNFVSPDKILHHYIKGN